MSTTLQSPEQKFSRWLRRKLPGQVCRVENCIDAGMPDIYLCDKNLGQVWVETKVSLGGIVLLEKEQYAWGMRNCTRGGKTRVVALDSNNNVLIFHFPIAVTTRGRYVAIVSTPTHRVVKSMFNCDLLT